MSGSTQEGDRTARVAVRERDRVNCDLLADHLSTWPYLDVIGTAVELEDVLELIDRRDPDLVICGVDGSSADRVQMAREIRAGRGDGRPDLVIFGIEWEPSVVLEFLEAGASTCLPNDATLDDLDRALRQIISSEVTLPPDVTYRAVRRLAELAELCRHSGLDATRLQRLTPRERQVLELLGEGLTNQEIADRLYVEVSTVKSHVHSVLEKLDVPTRDEAARYLILVSEETAES